MRRILTLGVAAVATMAVAASAQAQTVLKLQTAMAAGSFTLNYLNEVWVPKLEAMTYGNIKMEILPSKSVVPHRETPGAVAAGILQGDLNAVAYFAGKDQGYALLGDLIAGYDTAEQMQMFCRFGGGKEVLQKLYDKYNGGQSGATPRQSRATGSGTHDLAASEADCRCGARRSAECG